MAHLDIGYIYFDIISNKIYNLLTEILPEILVKQFLIKIILY